MKVSVKERNRLMQMAVYGMTKAASFKEAAAICEQQMTLYPEGSAGRAFIATMRQQFLADAALITAEAMIVMALAMAQRPWWLVAWDWMIRQYLQYRIDTQWLRDSWAGCTSEQFG